MWVEAWGQPVWQLSSEHSETVPSEEEEETWYNLSMTLFAPSHQGRSGVVVLWKVLPRPHTLPISVCARFQNCPFYLGAQSLAGSLLVFWLGLCTSGLVLGLLSVLWLHHRAANVHILLNTLTKTENTQVAYRKLRKDEKLGILILHLMWSIVIFSSHSVECFALF